jgi:CRISPR-associated protein Csb1
MFATAETNVRQTNMSQNGGGESTNMGTDATKLDFDTLKNAISGHAAAIRCKTILQPAAGPGTKVFPPTHSGGVYATEQRRLPTNGKPGETQVVDCVLLDSVQSQANRIEDALQQAIDDGRLSMPLIVVNFGDANKELLKQINDPITSLTVPHRLPDAILRDCEVSKGVRFKDSDYARRWASSTIGNATAVFELCPSGLILGMWGSPEKAGGLGNKFARALVSEIVGINAVFGVRTGSRIDPLQISSKVQVINDGKGNWRFADGKQKGSVNPAEIGHSNIPPSFAKYQKGAEGRDPLTGEPVRQGSIAAGGVTIDCAEHTAVLSLPQLRRLRFPLKGDLDKDPKKQAEIDHAARTVLAALALVGLTLSLERGCDLRSRCLLFPEGPLSFELLETPGNPTPIALDSDQAISIYNQAVRAAMDVGLPWSSEPITLTPSPELVALIKKSQELAAVSGEDEQEG